MGYGAGPGPRRLLLTGLTVTAPALTLPGHRAQAAPHGPRTAAAPRSGAATEWAPALVHGARTVHRRTGTAAPEHAPEAVYVFDLSVITADGRPHRALVRQPADVQGLARATTAACATTWAAPGASASRRRPRASGGPAPPAWPPPHPPRGPPPGRPPAPAPPVRSLSLAFLDAAAGALLAAGAVLTLPLTR